MKIWRYSILNGEDVLEGTFNHYGTGAFHNSLDQIAKIATLLISAQKGLALDEKDLEKISEVSGTSYDESFSLEQINFFETKNAAPVFIEQSIVAMVSVWENYFRCIFCLTFDDYKFLEALIDKKRDELLKFLGKSRLRGQFFELYTLKPYRKRLGTQLIDDRLLNFQDLDTCKKFSRLFRDFPLPTDKQKEWEPFTKLFDCRHAIVHNPSSMKDLCEQFDIKSLEDILVFERDTISKIDEALFTEWEID